MHHARTNHEQKALHHDMTLMLNLGALSRSIALQRQRCACRAGGGGRGVEHQWWLGGA